MIQSVLLTAGAAAVACLGGSCCCRCGAVVEKMITSVGTQHVLRTIGSAAFIIFFEAVSLLERQDFHKDSQFFASA